MLSKLKSFYRPPHRFVPNRDLFDSRKPSMVFIRHKTLADDDCECKSGKPPPPPPDEVNKDTKGLHVDHVGKILSGDTPIISFPKIRRFVVDCMKAVCVPEEKGLALARNLIEADYRGHYSYGLSRIESYVNECAHGSCNGAANPKIIKKSPSTAWVNGNNGLGVVVGNFCMRIAIEQAKLTGVGWVCAKNSNHYGIAGWYTLMAIKKGLIGLSFTNTSPLVSPCRSKKAPAIGTNPLAIAAPADHGDYFWLDMSTSTVSAAKVEDQKSKKKKLPKGWAQDSSGKITRDPNTAIKSGCLTPLGGSEITAGYKGTGLGLMVEILCGLSAGSLYGPKIPKKSRKPRATPPNLGQCFIAVDPERFAPGFRKRMSDLNDFIRNMSKADPKKPVLVAGDPERMHMRAVDACGGIRYPPKHMKSFKKLAKRLNIDPLVC